MRYMSCIHASISIHAMANSDIDCELLRESHGFVESIRVKSNDPHDDFTIKVTSTQLSRLPFFDIDTVVDFQ